jgi:exosortase
MAASCRLPPGIAGLANPPAASIGKNNEGSAMNPGLALFCLLPSAVAMLWLATKAHWFWMHQQELNFGYWVPLLCLYAFWRAWPSRPKERCRWTWGGLLCALLGAAILFLMQIYQAALGMMSAGALAYALGVFLVAAANVHYVFGWPGVRHFAFPYLAFVTALPMPTSIQSPIIYNLRNIITSVNIEILNFIGIPANGAGSVIEMANGVVGVDDACSGIVGFRACIMLSLFLGYFQLRYLATLLVVLGVGWSVLVNLLRTFALCYIVHAWGSGAVASWHDSVAFIFMVSSVAGVFAISWGLKKAEGRYAAFTTTLPRPNTIEAPGM